MSYRFGARSREALATVHPELRLVLEEALAHSPIDFGVSEGRRSREKQLEYFKAGKTTLDPRNPEHLARAKHIPEDPDGLADAADIFIWVPGKPRLAYDKKHLCMVAGVVMATASRLKAEGKVSCDLRWGGNWNGSGEILDQNFIDMVHFERVTD